MQLPRPLALASILLLSGCATYPVELETLEPATDAFPVHAESIGIIDRHVTSGTARFDDGSESDYPLGDLALDILVPELGEAEDKLNQKLNSPRVRSWAKIADQEIDGAMLVFADTFQPLQYYQVKVLNWDAASDESDFLEPGLRAPADPQRMTAFAKRQGVDVIVSVERLHFVLSERVSESKTSTKDKDGKITEDTFYEVRWTMSCRAVVRVFDSVSGLWVDERQPVGTSSAKRSRLASPSHSGVSDKYLIQDSLRRCLENYAATLTPRHRVFQRDIHGPTGGESSQAWQEGVRLLQEQWDAQGAIDLWSALLVTEFDSANIAKLRYNIAVAYESLRDYSNAITYATGSKPVHISWQQYVAELKSLASSATAAEQQLESL